MVRAGEYRLVAAAIGDKLVTAVLAHVVEAAQAAVFATHDHHVLIDPAKRDVVSGVFEIA